MLKTPDYKFNQHYPSTECYPTGGGSTLVLINKINLLSPVSTLMGDHVWVQLLGVSLYFGM